MSRLTSWLLVILIVTLFAVCMAVDDPVGPAVVEDEGGVRGVKGEPHPLSDDVREEAAKGAESHEFQAEVSRLMDIIINSLYSKREIFIREIISNAADALDKFRFLQLTNQTSQTEAGRLDIRIAYDRDAKTISITDTGVGMTKDDLIKNLGVVAKSGTSDFLEAATKGGDTLSLIGQFGVGFYSVYLVADTVTVISKHHSPEADQYIWESTAERTFTVSKDPRGNTMSHGTQVILHMKADSEEYLNEHEIKKLVARYSEFINYPIMLHLSKMVEREKVEAAEKGEGTITEEKKDDLEISDDEPLTDDTPKRPEVNTDRVEVWQWERINDVKAIWTRPPSDISEKEYAAFYKQLTKDDEPPLSKIHFTAEGEITFRSILFVPTKPPAGMYDKFYDKSTALKLYVRRVLISDEFDDFLPRYLNFVRGVVDSEDLPLNVSRETLAQSKVLKVMAKKITRKVLEMLKKMSDANRKKAASKEEDADDEEDEYDTFWKAYGKSIKLGIIDDRANKAKLSKLLRYVTSKSNGTLISLDEYVDRMKSTQKNIFYITGESLESVKKSPFVERLLKRDLEVVYMVDPVDEYLLQPLTEYDGTQFMSVTKEGLKIDERDEERLARYQEDFRQFTTWLQSTLGNDRVNKVTVSNRIANTPMVIVTGQYGWSANMERIMSGQTFANSKDTQHLKSKKTLEINPLHPIISTMKDRVAADPDDEKLKEYAVLLWDATLLQSGFMMDRPEQFAARVHRIVGGGLNIDPNAPIPEEEELPELEATEESTETTATDDEVLHEEL